jgi:hypothetical protein
LVFYEKVNRD